MAATVVDLEVARAPVPEAARPLGQELGGLKETADALQVTDQATFEQAAGLRQTLKLYRQRVSEVFDGTPEQPGIVAAAYKAHQVALGWRKRFDGPAADAEKVLKDRMDAYETALATERRRLEEEAQRVRDATPETLPVVVLEQSIDDILADAHAAWASGDEAAADRILETAEPVVAVPTPLAAFTTPVGLPTPTAPSVTWTTTWTAEITSPMELVRAIAAGKVPLLVTLPNGKAVPVITFNQTWLDSQARTQKDTLRIPGVKAVSKRSSSVSTKR